MGVPAARSINKGRKSPPWQVGRARFSKSLATLADDSLIDAHRRPGRIIATPGPRAATISAKPAPSVWRPKPRCVSALAIIEAATRRGTRETA
jgi:hypothetical protein